MHIYIYVCVRVVFVYFLFEVVSYMNYMKEKKKKKSIALITAYCSESLFGSRCQPSTYFLCEALTHLPVLALAEAHLIV